MEAPKGCDSSLKVLRTQSSDAASVTSPVVTLSWRVAYAVTFGDTRGGVTLVEGVDMIDATGAVSDFFGHTYYGDNSSILGDIFDPSVKISDASVVTLYLLPSLNRKLMPRLKSELKPGTRVVSNSFDMGDEWPAEKTQQVGSYTIYMWTIPNR